MRKRFACTRVEDIANVTGAIAKLDARISRFVELAGETDKPAPLLRKVAELEREREALDVQRNGWEKDDEAGRAFATITENQVRSMLKGMANEMRAYSREELRDFLAS